MASTKVRGSQLKTSSLANGLLTTNPLARSNHTGTQAQSTVVNLESDLAAKAPLAGPTFTGSVVVPTQSSGDSSAKAASTEFVQREIAAAILGVGKRSRCRVATTANITIATALNNGDSLNGVTLATGDLVLVKDQTAPEENGVYVVGASPARSAEFDTYDKHCGSIIAVTEGTTDADTVWFCTSNAGGTLDTTAISFDKLNVTVSDETVVTRETPTGSVNGTDGTDGNADFALANTPVAGSETVFVNGIAQDSGSGNDYTIDDDLITFESGAIPLTGDKVRVSYRY